MLPGVAPGRAAPGRTAPGRGAGGRGMGRSTGWADENGLLPTRGARAAGLGTGPGRGPGRICGGEAAGAGPAGGSGAVGGSAPAGLLICGAGAVGAPLPAALSATFSAAGLPPPNDSRSRRATGASTVEDADLTNSPCSLSRARTSLLVTPSSLANSCTRALPATTSPVYEATAVDGPRLGLAMTHGHRGFTVCSFSLLPVLLPGAPSDSICSATADVSGGPAMRSARVKARRRIAACAHCGVGCSHAPRPGRLPAVSTITATLPFPVGTATTRSSSTASSRFRHPTHVRTGPLQRCGRPCDDAEVSRWITA